MWSNNRSRKCKCRVKQVIFILRCFHSWCTCNSRSISFPTKYIQNYAQFIYNSYNSKSNYNVYILSILLHKIVCSCIYICILAGLPLKIWVENREIETKNCENREKIEIKFRNRNKIEKNFYYRMAKKRKNTLRFHYQNAFLL